MKITGDHHAKGNLRTKSPIAEHTISESLEYLSPGSSAKKNPPSWPPDTFALTALLLLRAGAYRHALLQWPPFRNWETTVNRLGRAWRKAWNLGQSPPKAICALWRTVSLYKETRLDSIIDQRDLCVALMQLSAVADYASYGIGLPTVSLEDRDEFHEHAAILLLLAERGSTLCESVHTTRIRVLPKMHTPQTGLTIRSFSHNLALCASDEMRPEWHVFANNPKQQRLNLLLVPWPYTVKRDQFAVTSGRIEMPRKFGFFEYRPRATGASPSAKLNELLQRAKKRGLTVDGVILPELALTLSQYKEVSEVVLSQKAFLIAGVAAPTSSPGEVGNEVYFGMPLPGGYKVKLRQAKHHRWRMDKWQVERYGLQRILNPRKLWWEHIPVEERCLYVVAMRPRLAISVLICEDLARPDPVGDLLRAVGPNLVVSLLLDGPQLSHRWSSRYAMALADDPGCSVLTLTSLGMAQLGRMRGTTKPSRAVGLWKDGQGGIVQSIELPPKSEAVILEVNVKEVEEYTADGRSDGKAAGIPMLKKMHFL
jgi:hypothetical protein